MNAVTLADAVRAAEAPDELVRARLAVARGVAREIADREPIVAALVVGSTSLRRCTPGADLDLVVVTPAAPGDDRFSTRWVDGVRVEVERLGRREALLCTGRNGWVWELRESARLGLGLPVHDPGRFAARLARRAAAAGPPAERYEATLRDVYLRLIDLAGGDGTGEGEGGGAATGGGGPGREAARRADVLRGCLDNLALLALLVRPRRYQKPKWALADLLAAGEDGLVDAVLGAYGVDDTGAEAVLAKASEMVARTYEAAGVPPHAELLAMGYAPEWAEASYVSRTLDDAGDLARSGRAAEAQYVARFSARLAASLLGPAGGAGIVDAFEAVGLAGRYLDLFAGAPTVSDHLLQAALVAADDRRRALGPTASPAMPA